MKVYVTGITGFAGGAIANYFDSQGHEITGIGRAESLPSHISKNCRYIRADICNNLTEFEADLVIHAAGLVTDTAPFKELYNVNVLGTLNVLNAAKNAGHVIYISSSSVYHFKEHALKEEEAGLHYDELSGYGKTKYLAEQSFMEDKHSHKKTILRPRAIYGKYDRSLLPRLMKLVKGNRLMLPAHLSKKISLTHIDNLVQAIALCIDKQESGKEIYNVSDKEVYDLHNILTTLLPLVAGKRLQKQIIPAWLFDLYVSISSWLKLNPSFNRFAADSLTKTGVINTEKIIHQLNYQPGRQEF